MTLFREEVKKEVLAQLKVQQDTEQEDERSREQAIAILVYRGQTVMGRQLNCHLLYLHSMYNVSHKIFYSAQSLLLAKGTFYISFKPKIVFNKTIVFVVKAERKRLIQRFEDREKELGTNLNLCKVSAMQNVHRRA